MPRTVSNCADEVRSHMDKNSLNLMTMEWQDFYVFVQRQVVRGSFSKQLQDEMLKRQMLYVEGTTCAIFVRDYNSVPASKELVNS